ncbi:MAG: DUF302 domain-containing protein [Thermocladium sp.]
MLVSRCRYGFQECEAQLRRLIEEAGMRIMAIIDHGKNAEEAGMKLGNVKVILFGNPRAGTLLMQVKKDVAIDLPMRIAIWDDDGETFIAYRLPSEIAAEHGIDHEVIKRMDEGVMEIIRKVLASTQ